MPLARASRLCQPIGKGLYQIPLFLLVDTQGLVFKCAGQAPARGIWPASFVHGLVWLSFYFLFKLVIFGVFSCILY